jgi:hypothetical protein
VNDILFTDSNGVDFWFNHRDGSVAKLNKAKDALHNRRGRHVKAKSLGELQLKELASEDPGLPLSTKAAILFSSCKSHNKTGSADNLLGTTDDIRTRCLELSQSTSLEQLAVYDQNSRKLSFQVDKFYSFRKM